VIQTYTPQNDVILAAAEQDYERFYDAEIRMRKLRRDPPFADQFILTVSGGEESAVLRAAAQVRDALAALAAGEEYRPLEWEVLGPAPAPVLKVNNRYRYRVTVIGKNDKGYVCASESSSFDNLGYSYVRDLGPGEIVQMTADGIRVVSPPKERMQVCSFLWVYYGYPSSNYEGINVEDSRYRCGAAMARRDDDTEADFTAGIPDSGVGHAIGYSNEKGIPYKRPFLKYTPTWPRSFMPQNQKMRDLVAKMKLLPNEQFTRDQKIIFMDDSIVRGTQLKDNVVKLYDAGVKEVHMRIACPPLIFPCPFLNFSTSRSSFDLYARRVIRDMEGTENLSEEVLREYSDPDSPKYKEMVETMRKHLQLTTLKFQRLDDLVEAIGLPKCKLCTHCWDNSSYME
jgi:amidophosphoribosyltransferase